MTKGGCELFYPYIYLKFKSYFFTHPFLLLELYSEFTAMLLLFCFQFAVADKKALSKISNYILKPKKIIPIVLSTVGSLALISAVILIAVLLKRYKLTKTDSASIHGQAESTFMPTDSGLCNKTDESPFDQWTVKPSPEHESFQVS